MATKDVFRAGLLILTLRSIRHSNITLQLIANVDMKTVSARAGHAQASTASDFYSHSTTNSDTHPSEITNKIFEENVKLLCFMREYVIMFIREVYMKLFSFRIKNYKSIIDSNECFLNNKTTVFAGQNESGKSNILSALTKINETTPSFKNEYNLDVGNKTESKIIFKFVLNAEEKEKIKEIKGFDDFIVSDEKKRTFVIINILEGKRTIEFNANLVSINEECKKTLKEFATSHGLKTKVTEYNEDILNNLEKEYVTLESFVEEDVHELKNKLSKIISTNEIEQYIETIIPKFILQTNSDYLPDSFTKGTSSTMLTRLQNYLNKTFVDVFNAEGDAQSQKNMLKDYSDSFNIEFESKYTQKRIQLDFDINGNAINIFIHDQDSEDSGKIGNSYKLSQRSQGLKWYLNFYITINGENIKDDDVILIDEPGMYLHAKAQEELRDEVLFSFPKQNQIIYTTHSPYLINSNELQSIRLVEKISTKINKTYYEQTIINEKLHAYNNVDSIKPIIDAIGYSIGSELNLNTKNMLICEGVSDCLYLKSLYKHSQNFGITHANGVSNILNLVLLYQGLGVKNIFVLIDSDKDGLSERKTLLDDKILEDYQILTTHGTKNVEKSIEDIFNKNFFLRNVMVYTEEEIQNSNEVISLELKRKKKKAGKYLLAKYFTTICGNYSLEEMLNNDGQKLINIIKEKIEKGD